MSTPTIAPSFEWISNVDDQPFLTVDNQRRIYFNAGTRTLLGVTPHQSWLIGYDPANKRLILAKPEIVRAANIAPFNVDKRFYMSARKFVDKLGLDANDLPINFRFIEHITAAKGAYPAGSYVFEAELDGAGTDL
ncbi:hypothetical protein [Lederbergia citri]|uniref:Uncharacterized protein n=1 Tax=Lederbergia citri TaxID=2833580 RepID=A0A942YFS1_9BACI|nr:hypothetical protein [Lederbergia citri]MBS4195348.1 hypothetical protein [Lederbergia citri]